MHKILFLVISLLISYEALSQEKTLTISVDLRLRNDKTMRLLMLGDSTSTVSVKRRKLANSNSIILSSDTLHVVQYLFSANSLGGDIELLVKGSQITTKVSSIINKKEYSLGLNISLTYLYDTVPAVKIENTDVIFKTGLAASW